MSRCLIHTYRLEGTQLREVKILQKLNQHSCKHYSTHHGLYPIKQGFFLIQLYRLIEFTASGKMRYALLKCGICCLHLFARCMLQPWWYW
jgi:hypothetical protein